MGDVHQGTYQHQAAVTQAVKDKVGGGGSRVKCEDWLCWPFPSLFCQKAVKLEKTRSVTAAAVRVKATLVNSDTVNEPTRCQMLQRGSYVLAHEHVTEGKPNSYTIMHECTH